MDNSDRIFKFIYLGSMASVKNSQNLAKALYILKRDSSRPFELRWIGDCNQNSEDHTTNLRATMKIIHQYGLEDIFIFEGKKVNVEDYLRKSDALVLCSLYEGLPNAICEGMASGLPIVASDVSDNGMIVKEGENGFLCDPFNVESITDSLKSCLEMPEDERKKYGNTSRRMAEQMFSRTRYLDEYEKIYCKVIDA